jgi:hypothetical protein
MEVRLLLKEREEGWTLAEPDSNRYDEYVKSNIPGVEVKHDQQSPETTNVGYKVTQKIFEYYDEVIVLSWKREFEASTVDSATTRVKNATADRVIVADN